MNREELERPFEDALIKTRKGAHGKTLRFVPSAEYVRRLNEASENGAWDFEVVEYKILDDEVIVLGKLTIDGTTKTAFGGSSITRTRDDNRVLSIASDLKSASSDSLKRCSMRLGLGLHLYTGATSRPSQPSKTSRPSQPPQSQEPRLVPRPSNNANGSRVTSKQLGALWGMGRSLGLSADAIRQRCQETFGLSPETLSRADASSFITELGAELDENRRTQQEYNRSRGAA